MTPNASSTGIESLSSYPRVAAIAPLDVATTGNPAVTTNRALATSHALGRTNGRGPMWRRRSASARSAKPPTSRAAVRRVVRLSSEIDVWSGSAFIVPLRGSFRAVAVRSGAAPKLIGRSQPRSRDGDEDEWAGADVAEVRYRKQCDREH